jgi:putative SOS response-associated peptidase YedK
MIDRYSLINTNSISEFLVDKSTVLKSLYNAHPTLELPIIDINKKKLVNTLWGSNPLLSNNKSLAKRLINLDISKIKKSNILLSQFKFDRCLIPCDGFYFWKKINKKEKIPFYFSFQKDKLMYCAGIKEKYEDLSGNSFYYFTFLTTQSDQKWRKYTNYSPMVFDPRYFDIWFDKRSNFNKILSFMSPFRFSDFINYSISPYFEKKTLYDKTIIEAKENLNQYGNYSLFD